MKIVPVRTSIGCPWQNGVAERWIGSCRREFLDHVIALNKRHLKRMLSEYVSYYHDDRTHIGLGKRTPDRRTPTLNHGKLIVWPRLGGLHHRYDRVA
jgi:putative transposase